MEQDKKDNLIGKGFILSDFNCRSELIKKMESYQMRNDFKLIGCNLLLDYIVKECLEKANQDMRNMILNHFQVITKNQEQEWIDIRPREFDSNEFHTVIDMDKEERLAKKRAIEEMDEDTLLQEASTMGLLGKTDFSNCLKKRKSSTVSPVLDIETLTSIQIFHENRCVCPLSKQVFKHPVLAPDGVIYDKKSLDDWTEKNGKKSPLTNIPFQHLNFLTVKFINDKCQDLIRKQIDRVIEILSHPENYQQFTSINLLELVKFSLTLRPQASQELTLKRLRIGIIERDSNIFLLQEEDISIFIGMLIDVCNMIGRQQTITDADKQEQVLYSKRIMDLTNEKSTINRVCSLISNLSNSSIEQIYERTIKFGPSFFQRVSSNLFEQNMLSFEAFSSFTTSKLAEPYQIAIGGYFTEAILKIKSKKIKK